MNCIIDRCVCPFLDTRSFAMFRIVCTTHANDNEAWDLRASTSFIHCCLTSKKTVGLHFLLSRAISFYDVDNERWLRSIINWVRYKISIKIMYRFILHYYPDFLCCMDTSQLSLRRRFIWERLWCRNENVYKTLRLCHDGVNKKRRILCY